MMRYASASARKFRTLVLVQWRHAIHSGLPGSPKRVPLVPTYCFITHLSKASPACCMYLARARVLYMVRQLGLMFSARTSLSVRDGISHQSGVTSEDTRRPRKAKKSTQWLYMSEMSISGPSIIINSIDQLVGHRGEKIRERTMTETYTHTYHPTQQSGHLQEWAGF